jgi:predicted nucleic acid-binding protein
MAADGPIYLDTNVIIHAFEKRDDLSVAITRLLTTLGRNGPNCATSLLTYGEAVQGAYARGDEASMMLTSNWLKEGTKTLVVGPISADVLFQAAVLRSTYRSLKLPDAIHIATAFGFGCRCILTADERIPAEIQLMNVRYGGWTKGPLVMPVLRPSVEAVQALLPMRDL